MSRSPSIPEDFSDAEYLYAYVEDFLNTKIATQIRVLREQRKLTQEELAKKIGTKQPGIARLENVNYSAWKIETLKKLARAFGVIFIGGFVSLRTFLDEEEKFGRKALEQPSFDEEIAEQEQDADIRSVADNAPNQNAARVDNAGIIPAPMPPVEITEIRRWMDIQQQPVQFPLLASSTPIGEVPLIEIDRNTDQEDALLASYQVNQNYYFSVFPEEGN